MIYNNEKIIENLDQILYELNITYKKYHNRLAFACPIHGGDKKDGASLFISGTKNIGNWKCWTNHCESEYGNNIIGFIRGTLTANENKPFSFQETLDWIESIIGQSIKIEYTEDDRAKYKAVQIVNTFNKQEEEQLGIERHKVRQSLIFPAKYFIERGFSQKILDKYDVGVCQTFGKQMHGRVVVPVYNDSGNLMIGCVGRTTADKCPKCEKYHASETRCPISSFEEYQTSKWINSKGFNAEKYLYNYWHAKDFISLNQTAILVEGQGDVWRLEESGINIGLGLFGASIKDSQILKLEKLPIINLVIAMDNDIAGIKCIEQINERLGRTYNIVTVNLTKKDVGEMSVIETQELFNPILQKYNAFKSS